MMAFQKPDRSPPPLILAYFLMMHRFRFLPHQLIPLTETIRPQVIKISITNDLPDQGHGPLRQLRTQNTFPDRIDNPPVHSVPFHKTLPHTPTPLPITF